MPAQTVSRKWFATPKQQTFLVGFGLVILTLFLYWPTIGYEFIVVDDDQYVFGNPRVATGLSWAGIKWAFTTLDVSNWHPLTWISHMVDCSIWGLFSGGHHLTNVLFHCANTLLLFLLLIRLTNAFWKSALVAALFAWHPTHIESVAWICERKDVLSAFFFILTLWSYGVFARRRTVGLYVLTLALFACGLMSKPMVVTLPFVLLLLDFWPLHRDASGPPTGKAQWAKLVAEKIPFFALSIGSSLLTMKAQHGAMSSLQHVTMPMRAANALGSYALYLEKVFAPWHLSVFYPLPDHPRVGLAVVAAAILIFGTAILFLLRSRMPALIVGWLWFLGTLVPVIGLVQVGSQAMADRYTYIPYIGLFIALVWGLDRIFTFRPGIHRIGSGLAVVAVIMAIVLMRLQLPYWHDSIRLFTRAIELTGSSAFVESNLSYSLSQAGRGREALPHYEAVLRMKPKDLRARFNYARELAFVGRTDEAIVQLQEALKYQPTSEKLHNNLGLLFARKGDHDVALQHFAEATRLDPDYVWPVYNSAMVYQRRGMAGPAVTNYTKVLALQPNWSDAASKLALLLAACPDPQWHDAAKALKLAEQANAVTENKSADDLRILAFAQAANGAFSNAVATAKLALQNVKVSGTEAMKNEIQQELQSYRAGKLPPMDWTNIPIAVFNAR